MESLSPPSRSCGCGESWAEPLFQWAPSGLNTLLPNTFKHQIATGRYHNSERALNFPDEVDITFLFNDRSGYVSADVRADVFSPESIMRLLSDVRSTLEFMASNQSGSLSAPLCSLD